MTFQRRGTSETCSTDIYSCFSCGCGSLDHICRKLALTWWFFEKSPAEKRKTWKRDARNCQCHRGPAPHTQSTSLCTPWPGSDGFPKQAKLLGPSSPLLLCSYQLFPTHFDTGVKFSKSWRSCRESVGFKGYLGCLRWQHNCKGSEAPFVALLVGQLSWTKHDIFKI